jgi:hypothetical protein
MRVLAPYGRCVSPPLPEISLAGVAIDVVSDVAGTTIVLTGLLAAALRTGAVLAKSSPERVEWLTALGFLWGAMIAAMLLTLDAILS